MLQGLRKQGGRGVNCPPTFAENRAKLVNNKQISAKIWFVTPHFWALTPHFSVASEDPDGHYVIKLWKAWEEPVEMGRSWEKGHRD